MGNSNIAPSKADRRLDHVVNGYYDSGSSGGDLMPDHPLAAAVARRWAETKKWVNNPRKSQFIVDEASVAEGVPTYTLDLPQSPNSASEEEDQLPPGVTGPVDDDQGFETDSFNTLLSDHTDFMSTGYSEHFHTLGLAFHAGTGFIYTLSSTDSGLLVSRMKVAEEADLSFMISSRMAAQGKIVVVRDYVITYSEQQYLKIHNLHGVRENMVILRKVLDLAGSQSSSIYCLLEKGRVVELSVPVIGLLGQSILYNYSRQDSHSGPTQIASCPLNKRVATLDYDSNTVTVYDAGLNPLQSISIDVDVTSDSALYLSGDEVVVGAGGTLYYVDYNRSSVMRVTLGYDVTGLCYMDPDHVLVASDYDVIKMDLRDVRRRGQVCPKTGTHFTFPEYPSPEVRIQAKHNCCNVVWKQPKLGADTQKPFYNNNCCNGYSIRINKCSGELMQVFLLGHVTVYSRDVTRPLEEFRLPLPDGVEVRRFDTTDEGEVAAISGDAGGQLLIFSLDRQLLWSARLGQPARDVVCCADVIHVLTDDHVMIFTRELDRTEESRRLPLGLGDLADSRLAVHGNVLYLLVPGKCDVLRMDLSDPVPSFSPFLQDEDLYPRCLAVSDDGKVVLAGRRKDMWGTVGSGLFIYSPDGKEMMRLVTGQLAISDLALRPGGGVYFRASDGLHFLEHF